MGFHTSLRSTCAMATVGWSGIKLAAIGLRSNGNALSGVMNNASPSGSPTDESGFGGCQENATCAPMHSANCKATAYNDSLGKALFCFSMTMLLCTKRGPYRNGLSIGVEELDWPTQSPDLNPIDHLWDELECYREPGLIAQHQCQTSLMLVAEWKQVPAALFQHLVESFYSSNGGGPTLNAHDFGMICSTSRCPHTFGHAVYLPAW
jgi:hypothetical protein